MELAARTLASNSLTLAAIALEVVAVVGVIGSLMIQRVPSANPTLEFPWNPIQYSWRDMKLVFGDRPLLRVTLGIAFFWSLASLAQMNIDVYVTGELNKSQTEVGIFLAVLSLGVGLGSVLAGWWSGGRVELGMVPLGALLMSVACVILFMCHSSSMMAGAMLASQWSFEPERRSDLSDHRDWHSSDFGLRRLVASAGHCAFFRGAAQSLRLSSASV